METKRDEKNNHFRTADFGVICTLNYLGFEFEGFERDDHNPNKVAVHFKQSSDLNNALKLLWSKQQSVEPLSFMETTRAVRGRLRDSV